jgi:hypothetical protein
MLASSASQKKEQRTHFSKTKICNLDLSRAVWRFFSQENILSDQYRPPKKQRTHFWLQITVGDAFRMLTVSYSRHSEHLS